MTSTNEYLLKNMLEKTGEDELLRLQPSEGNPGMIDIYRLPVRLAKEFNYLGTIGKEKYWLASLMAIELHPKDWRTTSAK